MYYHVFSTNLLMLCIDSQPFRLVTSATNHVSCHLSCHFSPLSRHAECLVSGAKRRLHENGSQSFFLMRLPSHEYRQTLG